MKIRKVLAEKQRNKVFTVPSDATVKAAAEILCQHRIGALLVTEPGTEPAEYVGIITERDILNQICYVGEVCQLKVAELMTADLIVSKSDDDVEQVMGIMTLERIRHIPVIEEKKVIGLVSIGDIIKSLQKEQQIRIRHLSDYVGNARKSDVF